MTRAVLIAAAVLPVVASATDDGSATSSTDDWHFAALLYVYAPQINGSTYFPVAGTGESITVDQSQIFDNLKMTAMGSFDAHYGDWGGFTDAIYLNIGDSKSGLRDFAFPNGFPIGSANARVNLDVKSWIVTWGLEYRLLKQSQIIFDTFVGGRYLYLRNQLDWNISGDIGMNPPQTRAGNVGVGGDEIDAVVGFKGDWKFTGNDTWALPFYADLGGGGSKLTWQVAAGVGYHLGGWEIEALYREINYHIDATRLKDFNVKGPALAAAYRW